MSLVAAPRANNLSQLNTVTEIKYSSRNNTARDHSMIAVKGETPVHGPARSFGTVQVEDVRSILVLDRYRCPSLDASSSMSVPWPPMTGARGL